MPTAAQPTSEEFEIDLQALAEGTEDKNYSAGTEKANPKSSEPSPLSYSPALLVSNFCYDLLVERAPHNSPALNCSSTATVPNSLLYMLRGVL